jgi:glyoxylase-like metal-dependent hydrolase (beta-lactamase superfamily II)
MQIADGVYAIRQREGFECYASGFVNAYLLEGGDDLILIDTLYDTNPRLILDQLVRMGRTLADLTCILLTHGHRSHLGGLKFLKETSGAEVYAHKWEADIIAGKRGAQAVTLQPTSPAVLYPQRLGLALGLGKQPPCRVDRLLEDQNQPVGPLKVIHTPGHTPGHLSFYWEERGVLFTGDAIATWPEFGAGWPSFNLNEEEHQKSVRRLAHIDAEVVAVSHGEPIVRGAKKRLRSLIKNLETGNFSKGSTWKANDK